VTCKSNLLLGVVVSSVVLVACSGNANTTAESNPASQTTVAKVCNSPAQLDCADANLRGADLTDANLTGATMPDGTRHE